MPTSALWVLHGAVEEHDVLWMGHPLAGLALKVLQQAAGAASIGGEDSRSPLVCHPWVALQRPFMFGFGFSSACLSSERP